MKNLHECEILTKQELEATQNTTLGCSAPKDHQNRTDNMQLPTATKRKEKSYKNGY